LPVPSRSIVLTPDIIPVELKVVAFDPDRLVRIAIPERTLSKLWTLSISFPIYMGLAYALTSLIAKAISLPPGVSLIAVVAAACLCIILNYRGIVLTIWLKEPRFQIVNAASFDSDDGIPKIGLMTTSTAGIWKSELSICGYIVATRTSLKSSDEAQHPFAIFAGAFGQYGSNIAKAPVTDASPETSVPAHEEPLPKDDQRPSKGPLIILVHGTWGDESAWAIPEQSALVSAVTKALPISLQFRRLSWSGDNSVSARREAAGNLSEMIRSELNAANRLIFVFAHSHGGNVAVSAAEDLPNEQRRSIRLVLMATPFLKAIQRFDVQNIFELLPSFMQSNLYGICMFGFWFGSLLIQLLLKWPILFAGETHGVWVTLLSIFQFLAPILLFNWIWRRMEEFIAQLPGKNLAQEDGQPSRCKTLVLAYSQDEAFMTLSVVVNLLSLVHQLFFLGIAAVAWVSSRIARIRLIDWLTGLPGLPLLLFMILTFWSISTSIAIHAIAEVWPDIAASAKPIFAIFSSLRKSLWSASESSLAVVLGFMMVLGLIVVLTLLSMVIVGTVRALLFLLIGVLDQVRSKNDFFNAALGGVMISMIPEGHAQTVMIDGRAMFNHVNIYDDPKTLKEIIRFVSEETNPASRT
jgi:pimeloyl-ACP methyl ester carboxylesterase